MDAGDLMGHEEKLILGFCVGVLGAIPGHFLGHWLGNKLYDWWYYSKEKR